MPHNLYKYGRRRAGSTGKILAAGFSGIADTLWVVAVPMTSGKFGDGVHYGDMKRRLRNTALKETGLAGRNSDKRYFTGPTTPEEYEIDFSPQYSVVRSTDR
jgi:hypothetical protein